MSNQNEKIMEALSALHGLMGAKRELVEQVRDDLEGSSDEQKVIAIVFMKELPFLDAVLGVLMEAAGLKDEEAAPEGTTIQ